MKGMPVTAIDPVPPQVEDDVKPVGRVRFFGYSMLAFVMVIVAQLVRWQVVERKSRIQEIAIRYSVQTTIPPQRGLIRDANGAFLALNSFEYQIEATPRNIKPSETEMVVKSLARVLDHTEADLEEKLSGDALYALIAWRVSKSVGEQIAEMELPGIIAQPVPDRIYPEHTLAAHILGFATADGQGYYGLEGFYDAILKGEAGIRGERFNPWTHPVSFADRRADEWRIPQEGHTLILTIDRTTQFLIERELARAVLKYGAESGSIVVMDPKTGAMLAMASYPTYDPNDYSETDDKLFVDPIIGSLYEPGSTFKVVTISAALDEGVITARTPYNDLGYIEVGGRYIRNWDNRAYGSVTMLDVVVKSLNTGTAYVCTLLGPSRFYDYVDRFGFDRKTGIDMQGEAAGLVREQGDAEWHESDLGTNAFGQGLAATPLQMVVAVGAVANRGFLMQPYIVGQLVRNERAVDAKQVAVRQVIREDVARVVTNMMVKVVEEGATLAQVPGYRIAGKTGTAQTPVVGGYDPNLTIASFIGFAPADDPQFVALVKLDKPTESPWGSSTAAPTFARVAQILFTQLAIPPDHAQLAAY